MSILDNEKVREYFGRGSYESYIPEGYPRSREWIAFAVLDAMQQPIKKGERFLAVENDWSITEGIAMDGYTPTYPGRRFDLRLPDRFQKKECESMMVKCEQCGYEAAVHMPKQGDTIKFNFNKPTPEPTLTECSKAIPSFWGKSEPEKCGCGSPLNHVKGCAAYVNYKPSCECAICHDPNHPQAGQNVQCSCCRRNS